MKIYKQDTTGRKEIVIENRNNRFIMGWYGSDIYWVMTNYNPGNVFTIKGTDNPIFTFLSNLFQTEHFNNSTFTWISEARIPEESSTLKITKGKNCFRIRFIQGDGDYLAKAHNICPICFCLSGSRNQRIADQFSMLLHELLNRDFN